MIDYPSFPVFRKVTLADREMHDDYYKQYEPYSDFSFNNLVVWMDYCDDLYASLDGDNLVLRFSNPLGDGSLTYSVIGKRDCARTIKKVFELQESLGVQPRIDMVPEVVVRNLGHDEGDGLSMVEDPNNKDYIFDASEIHELKGGRLANLRHKINYFMKHYSKVEIRELDLANAQTRRLLVRNMYRWFSQRSMGEVGSFEGKMVERHLEFARDLSPYCLGIFKSNRLIAFSIFHPCPQPGFAIGHHMKYDPSYRYLFDFAYWATMSWMDTHHIKYVNGEQDLGLDGLRAHKEEMRPCGYLRRYTVCPQASLRSNRVVRRTSKTVVIKM